MPYQKDKHKRRKLVTADEARRCRRDVISTLPLELISDILLRLGPKDILAMARCNKHFCRILTDPNVDYIWKAARNSLKVPEPTSNFTESAYAAFVFDGGSCDFRMMGHMVHIQLAWTPGTSLWPQELQLSGVP